MISKQFRFNERQVKKVLSKAKPFFSYGLVLNKLPNRLSHNRYAIVIGSKSVNHNVTRNFFRRRYYEYMRTQISLPQSLPGRMKGEQSCSSPARGGQDIVCVVKKQTKLDRKDKNSIMSFDKDLQFLFKKI